METRNLGIRPKSSLTMTPDTSKIAEGRSKAKRLILLKWPAFSQARSPIEYLWRHLKQTFGRLCTSNPGEPEQFAHENGPDLEHSGAWNLIDCYRNRLIAVMTKDSASQYKSRLSIFPMHFLSFYDVKDFSALNQNQRLCNII